MCSFPSSLCSQAVDNTIVTTRSVSTSFTSSGGYNFTDPDTVMAFMFRGRSNGNPSLRLPNAGARINQFAIAMRVTMDGDYTFDIWLCLSGSSRPGCLDDISIVSVTKTLFASTDPQQYTYFTTDDLGMDFVISKQGQYYALVVGVSYAPDGGLVRWAQCNTVATPSATGWVQNMRYRATTNGFLSNIWTTPAPTGIYMQLYPA
ncbi:hypothetical protein ACK3TF_000774 [Chlorella vulgaris]